MSWSLTSTHGRSRFNEYARTFSAEACFNENYRKVVTMNTFACHLLCHIRQIMSTGNQHICDHDHDDQDPMCLLRDKLWQQLYLYDVIDNSLTSEDTSVVTLLSSTIMGDVDITNSPKLVNMRKNLQWQRRGHDKYVGHLMLDNM